MPAVIPLDDPTSAFIEAACVKRDAQRLGTLEEAETILGRYPYVVTRSIYAAALVADEPNVRMFLARDPASAVTKGGLAIGTRSRIFASHDTSGSIARVQARSSALPGLCLMPARAPTRAGSK
ncbi:MAG TPA: hypothetical protein VGJ20_17070 [Xanthobacteraceae bacterium]